MRDALIPFLDTDKPVTLIGYSGGAALALLLAHEIPNTNLVVGVAGLQNTDSWTSHHGYEPLSDSLNPIDTALLPQVQYLFLHGALDQVVPIGQVTGVMADNAHIEVF